MAEGLRLVESEVRIEEPLAFAVSLVLGVRRRGFEWGSACGQPEVFEDDIIWTDDYGGLFQVLQN